MKNALFLMAVSAVCMMADCAPVRSMLAMRDAINESEATEKWVNPYITDGLIAMWDGVWNIGGGKHDPDATVWKDLVGYRDLTLTEYGHFDDNSFYAERNSSVANMTFAANYIKPIGGKDFELISAHTEGCILVDSGMEGGSQKLITFANPYGVIVRSYTPCVYMYGLSGNGGKIKFNQKMSISSKAEPNYSGIVYVNGQDATVGSYNHYVGTGGGRFIDVKNIGGHLYNIRVYNRELTIDEIQHNYLVDKERFGL